MQVLSSNLELNIKTSKSRMNYRSAHPTMSAREVKHFRTHWHVRGGKKVHLNAGERLTLSRPKESLPHILVSNRPDLTRTLPDDTLHILKRQAFHFQLSPQARDHLTKIEIGNSDQFRVKREAELGATYNNIFLPLARIALTCLRSPRRGISSNSHRLTFNLSRNNRTRPHALESLLPTARKGHPFAHRQSLSFPHDNTTSAGKPAIRSHFFNDRDTPSLSI